MKLQTVADIRLKYPDEWVLLEIVHDRKDTERVVGRVLAHSPSRGDLDEPYSRFRADHPTNIVYEFFTGELVPEGVVVIL